MISIINKKILPIVAVSILSLSALTPITQVFATENENSIALSTKDEALYNKLFNSLSDNKKIEFNELRV